MIRSSAATPRAPTKPGMSSRNAASCKTVFRRIRHVGLEIMDLPLPRNREMNGIDFAVDDHNATLAMEAVTIARVECLDEAHIVAGERQRRCSKLWQIFNTHKITPGVEAGRPHQERKIKIIAGNDRSGLRSTNNRRGTMTVRGATTFGSRRRRSAFEVRPVLSTAVGWLISGRSVRASTPSAASRPSPQRSASPMLLKTRSCCGSGTLGSAYSVASTVVRNWRSSRMDAVGMLPPTAEINSKTEIAGPSPR